MKRTFMRKFAIGAAVLMAATNLTGCSTKIPVESYAQTVVATFGDENIYLSEPNFFLKYNQWYTEMLYSSYYSDMTAVWQQVYDGKTVEASMKEDAMAAVLQTRILMSNAQNYGVQLTEEDKTTINEAVTSFLAGADAKLIAATGLTAETYTDIYTNNFIANKVKEAMVADTDKNVSDEEARQAAIDYIQVDEDASDPEWAKRESQIMFDRAQAGEGLDTIAYDYDLVVNQKTLGADESIELNTKAMALKVGETALVTNGESGYYVIYCSSELDEAATQTRKEAIITERENENFKTLYENLRAAAPELKVIKKVWSPINLKTKIYVAETTSAVTTAADTTSADTAVTDTTSAEASQEESSALESESEEASVEETTTK